jgi:NAD(P)-dependent dehydrogenase (short-subunit alcohol dehydrogenase family)
MVIVVTGASSGFGALTVRALARAGHTVYAGIRETAGRNAPVVEQLARDGEGARAIELDVSSQESADAAIARIIDEQGRLDAIVHNAGHMVLGPAEAFTPEQLADVYDVNVLGAQRSTAPPSPTCASRAKGCSCGSAARARAGAARRSSARTSRPRRRWTRSPSATRAS